MEITSTETQAHVSEVPECCICLMPIKYGEPAWLVMALECGHCFHKRCILTWGRECPECRRGEKMIDLVTIDCELHTDKYRRCITIKMLRRDCIELLYTFIRESTKIAHRHLTMRQIEVRNNTIDTTSDPPRMTESIQDYSNRRESLLNKLMGFSTLYNIKIHFSIDKSLASKINTSPLKYKFSNPKDVYIPLEIDPEDSLEDDELDELIGIPSEQLCCHIL